MTQHGPNLIEYSIAVDAEMKRVVSGRGLTLYSMMEHHLGWGDDLSASDMPGRISPRPRKLGAVCLSVCDSLGGNTDAASSCAAAIELVQGFCEIHDDIQNGKVGGDGRDSVWWRWGPAQAINAGDGMHALARLVLLGLDRHGLDSDTIFESVKLLDRASLVTCEGRFMDLDAQERLDVTSDAYLRMAEAKTGSLFACAMEFGALTAGADDELRAVCADAGRRLGISVQISQDLAELVSSSECDVQPSDSVMNKKKLYPVVRAFEMATPSERRRLGDYYFKRVMHPDDIRGLVEIIGDLGAIDEAEAKVQTLLDEAIGSFGDTFADASGVAHVESLMRIVVGKGR